MLTFRACEVLLLGSTIDMPKQPPVLAHWARSGSERLFTICVLAMVHGSAIAQGPRNALRPSVPDALAAHPQARGHRRFVR